MGLFLVIHRDLYDTLVHHPLLYTSSFPLKNLPLYFFNTSLVLPIPGMRYDGSNVKKKCFPCLNSLNEIQGLFMN